MDKIENIILQINTFLSKYSPFSIIFTGIIIGCCLGASIGWIGLTFLGIIFAGVFYRDSILPLILNVTNMFQKDKIN